MKQMAENGEICWRDMAYSDESSFALFGSEGRQWMRIKKDWPLEPRIVKARVLAGGGKIQCYGAISRFGTSKIAF